MLIFEHRKRKENLERAMEHEAAGNSVAAFDCYQKAVDISPSIAFELIKVGQIYVLVYRGLVYFRVILRVLQN